MHKVRLIARLDVKAPNLVKGIQLEGLRKLGDPSRFALDYYDQGIDEIIYMDIVASLFDRNSLLSIIERTTEDVFVPITVGGGLRTIDDVARALRAGADKIAINTAAIKDPDFITQVARRFGSQCMVLSIEAKRCGQQWEAYYDNGREPSGKDVVAWAKRGEQLGAGEIMITSVDREGGGKGFDVELVKAVTSCVGVPVIASGGMGNLDHITAVVESGRADGVAMARVLHYGHLDVSQIRAHCLKTGVDVRHN